MPVTDEERLELAKKLDEELDDFINGLKKKPCKNGWSEDKWEEVSFTLIYNITWAFSVPATGYRETPLFHEQTTRTG